MENKKRMPLMRRFAANTGWLVAQNVFQYMLSAVIGILAARFLGPANYGILGYGLSLIALLNAFAGLGIADVLIPVMIESPEEKGDLIGTGLVLRLLSSTLSVFMIAGIAMVLRPGEKLLLLVTVLQSLQLLLQAVDLMRLWFQMELLNKYTAIGSILGNIACSAWRIVLLVLGASVEWFALTNIVQLLTNNLFIVPFFFAKAHLRLSVSLRSAKKLLARSWHFILSGTANAGGAYIGRLVLAGVLGDTSLGWYNAAFVIATMWLFVPQALIDSSLPVLLETKKKSADAFYPRYQLLLAAVIGISVLAGIGLSVLAPFLIRFLYGEAYAPAAGILRIVAWVGVFSSIGSARGIWLQAERRQYTVKYISFISAGVSIVLSVVFIPLFGTNGAAVACVLGHVVSALIAPLIVPGSRPFVPLTLTAWKAALGYIKVWERGKTK